MIFLHFPILAAVHAGFVLALLTACASSIPARVTRFNQWPADAAGSTVSCPASRDKAA